MPELAGGDGQALADLDGDGLQDMVAVYESDTEYDGRPRGHVRIAFGSGDPHRWQLVTLASGAEVAAAEDVAIADFDADGDADIIVACELAHLTYFENPGSSRDASQWRRAVVPATQGRGSFIRVFAADLDGDGRPEVVTANKGEQKPAPGSQTKRPISVFVLPQRPPEVGAWREVELGRVISPVNAMPVDMDADGDLDVLAGSRGKGRVLWFENRGRLNFTAHKIDLADLPPGVKPIGFNLAVVDVTADGERDVLCSAWPGVILLLQEVSSGKIMTVDIYRGRWQCKRMSRTIAAKSDRTRRRILDAAATAFREHGVDRVGVRDVMKRAGLTRGGFYFHFADKDALLAAAMREAAQSNVARHICRDENTPKGQKLRAFIDDYLSEGHRDQRDVGCIIAALGGDIGRANAKQRKAFTEGVDITLERVAEYLPGATAAERRASAELLTSSMAGVLMVSRSLSDRPRSNALLARARQYFSTAFGA